jgi:hypothetical protein
MQRNLHYLLLILFTFSITAFSQNAAEGVQASLSLSGGQTVYRTGEPIRLILTFTANSSDKYNLLLSSEEMVSTPDEVFLSPSEGAFGWAAQYERGMYFMNDHFGYTNLAEKPINIERALNKFFRFDKPGSYSVRVRTKRVSAGTYPKINPSPLVLTTNAVSLEITPMSETEEAREVERLSSLLNVRRPFAEEFRFSEELAFLTGDVSTREKVRRFLNPQEKSGNYYQNIYHGLFIARNRALVIRLLEEALRDLARPASFQLLNALVQLRFLQDARALPNDTLGEKDLQQWREKGTSEIRQAYLNELVESLLKREGKSRITTAVTILDNFRRENLPPIVLTKVREIILADFDNLHPYEQSRLLSAYGQELCDASLLPSLKRMLTNNRDWKSWQLRATGIKCLMELAPEQVRPFVVYEILEPLSFADFDVLKKLEDPFLPETDVAPLERIRVRGVNSIDNTYLRHTSRLIARFATAWIYKDLMKIYKTYGAKWGLDARGGLLAYFARHNEKEAMPLIEQELAGLSGHQSSSFLASLTNAYYSEGINELLKKRLDSNDPDIASSVPWLMSKYGSATNKQVFLERLGRWRKEWSERGSEINADGSDQKIKNQARVEGELVSALIRSASWKLSEAETNQLKQSCVSGLCRRLFPVQSKNSASPK